MQGNIPSRCLLHLSFALLILLSMLLAFPSTASGKMLTRMTSVTPHFVTARPQYVYAGAAAPGAEFPCETSTSSRCYTPQQMLGAYDIQPVHAGGITGKGSTIVIVDAFQSPTIEHDLQLFDRIFDIADTTLNIIAPDGQEPFDSDNLNQVGWEGEITLDVEWAHAIAPDATIDLVLAKSNQDLDIQSAIKYAVGHNLGDVLSFSFGEAENCMDPQLLREQHSVFFDAEHQHMTLLASSGDQGAASDTCHGGSLFLSVDAPASDPLVTAVGGTQLSTNDVGTLKREAAWNEAGKGVSGGGFSTIYRKPSYQMGVPGMNAYRGVPDVAYNAAVNGGVLTVWSLTGQDQAFTFGGTSASAPQWAGIVALGVQRGHKRLGLLNPALYAIAQTDSSGQAFHDITVGNNTFIDHNSAGDKVAVNGYAAGGGWDPVTGWGSPKVSRLLPLLEAQSHFPS